MSNEVMRKLTKQIDNNIDNDQEKAYTMNVKILIKE